MTPCIREGSNWLDLWSFAAFGSTVPPRDPDAMMRPKTKRTTSRTRTASRRSSENQTNRRAFECCAESRGDGLLRGLSLPVAQGLPSMVRRASSIDPPLNEAPANIRKARSLLRRGGVLT
jgi:hypothetical protein